MILSPRERLPSTPPLEATPPLKYSCSVSTVSRFCSDARLAPLSHVRNNVRYVLSTSSATGVCCWVFSTFSLTMVWAEAVNPTNPGFNRIWRKWRFMRREAEAAAWWDKCGFMGSSWSSWSSQGRHGPVSAEKVASSCFRTSLITAPRHTSTEMSGSVWVLMVFSADYMRTNWALSVWLMTERGC